MSDQRDAVPSQAEESLAPSTTPYPTASSDGSASELPTRGLPPLPQPPLFVPPLRERHAHFPQLGETICTIELRRVLGEGAFARVYLGWEDSMNRLVALKVSRQSSREARTLGPLVHNHIVTVHWEGIDPDRGLRLLCMQYIAGTTLSKLIEELAKSPFAQRGGQQVLAILDQQPGDPPALDLAAVRDRETLAEMDMREATCWLGSRLAEALAHAHQAGVLHCDIKPANVLVNHYGRPFLADFNVSVRTDELPDDRNLGGTIAYMAPEHIEAFVSGNSNAVGTHSDLYSLGLVLRELLTGQSPISQAEKEKINRSNLSQLADQRRASVPDLPAEVNAPLALRYTLIRCLAPQPEQRFENAGQLASTLDGCRQLLHARRQLPARHALTALLLRRPLLCGLVLLVIPQVVATLVNIAYNLNQIILPLAAVDPRYLNAFLWTVAGYNSVIYPVCLGYFFWKSWPALRAWLRLREPLSLDPAEVDSARRSALLIPDHASVAIIIGWFGGGIVFPLALQLSVGGVTLTVFAHFFLSFLISGLISLTYSALALQFVVLRVLYLGMWLHPRAFHETVVDELQGEENRLAVLQVLAVLIPISCAALLLGLGPASLAGDGHLPGDDLLFRQLVTVLLGLSVLGQHLALWVSGKLRTYLSGLRGVS